MKKSHINKLFQKLSFLLSSVLAFLAVCPLFSAGVSAEELMRLDQFQVMINDQEYDGTASIGAYTNGYDNHYYFSLKDLASLLHSTSACFDFYLDEEADCYKLVTGQPYSVITRQEEIEAEKAKEAEHRAFAEVIKDEDGNPVAYKDGYIEKYPYLDVDVFKQNFRVFRLDENSEWVLDDFDGDYYDEDGDLRDKEDRLVMVFPKPEYEAPDLEYLDLAINPLQINDLESRYYTVQLSAARDIYMNYTDLQLMLDITMSMDKNGMLHIYTDRGFEISIEEYEEDGYFDLFNGVAVGDVSTGQILFGCKEDNVDAIASTSKLMTYLVVSRYIELGRISMDDVVVLSQNVENLAYSGYGTLYMDMGQEVTVRDLLGALLLASSNESALALAEYTAGSEAAFVELMNKMAQMLGLESARFYNSNGLPVYSDKLIASKRQNRMTAADLFRLSSIVLRKYPEITEFTSLKWLYLPSFDYSVSNTNYLLYNMSDAIGLKTGTTDEAGCCLTAASRFTLEDGEHTLAAVILGAENNIDRYQVPALLLKWGRQYLSQQ